jgi:hypothetical protein
MPSWCRTHARCCEMWLLLDFRTIGGRDCYSPLFLEAFAKNRIGDINPEQERLSANDSYNNGRNEPVAAQPTAFAPRGYR